MSDSDISDDVPIWDILSDLERWDRLAGLEDKLEYYDAHFLSENDVIVTPQMVKILRDIAVEICDLGFTVRDVAARIQAFKLVEHLWDTQRQIICLYRYWRHEDCDESPESERLREMCNNAIRRDDCIYKDEEGIWESRLVIRGR